LSTLEAFVTVDHGVLGFNGPIPAERGRVVGTER
jgi:hypothetical protein